MKDYNVSHNLKTTIVSTTITSNGFKEEIQYEFKYQLSDLQIQQVYDSLTVKQQEAVSGNKTGFKQFVRAILIAYPKTTDPKTANRSRSDEARRYISRVSPYVNMSSSEALTNQISVGTMSPTKHEQLLKNHPKVVHIEDEKLLYVQHEGLVVVGGVNPVERGEDAPDLYLYGIFTSPTD